MGLIGATAVLASQVAVTNSVADATILSTVIPANGVAVGSHFRFEAAGSTSISVSGQGFSVWIALGGTKIATLSVTLPQPFSGQAWHVNGSLTVRSLGASGSALAMLRGLFFASAEAVQDATVPSGTSALNTTAAMTLSVGMTWGAASTSNTATADHAVIQQVA